MAGKNSKKKKNSAAANLFRTAAAAAAIYGGASWYLFEEIFNTKDGVTETDAEVEERQKLQPWFYSQNRQDVYIQSFDGLKLHGVLLENHPQSDLWVILVHGYKNSLLNMMPAMRAFSEHDCNVLAIDLRGYGMSEGTYTGMGWPEHYDLVSWTDWLAGEKKNSRIVLMGVSMGAAAVMYALGEPLSDHVVAAVEDCGFADCQKELSLTLEKRTGKCINLMLPGLNLFIKQKLHYSLKDVSVMRQLSNAQIPLLIIHGDADDVVSVEDADAIENSSGYQTEKWIVEGAGHNEACRQDTYFEHIFAFLDKYLHE